jgi:hypothetical protein
VHRPVLRKSRGTVLARQATAAFVATTALGVALL